MESRFAKTTKTQTAAISYLPSTSRRSSKVIGAENQFKRDYAWQVAANLFVSFKYAWDGVRYAFVTQRNFRLHVFLGVVAISLGAILGVTPVEMAVVTVTCALVMVLELLNTALESVVDLTVGQSYHQLAKTAKDCAAGAVLISAVAALLVAIFILITPILNLFFAVQ